MSRIGKKPVEMPSGVSASIDGSTLTVKGPKGTLSMPLMDDLVSYKVEEGQISVTPISIGTHTRGAAAVPCPGMDDTPNRKSASPGDISAMPRKSKDSDGCGVSRGSTRQA